MGDALDGARLDRVVREVFGLSWGRARNAIGRGKVSLDGVTVSDPAHGVATGARLLLDPVARRIRPDTDLPDDAIVFMDDHVVVVNKPAGITTIPFEDREKGTLDARVRARIARIPGARKRAGRVTLGVVHRIDRGTSGLVVFARTWKAKTGLAMQFKDHTVHREYVAVARGHVDDATFRSHIVADRGDGRRGSVEAAPGRVRPGLGQGKLAITHVRVVRRLRDATLLSCRLETGRTHQIRIHLAEAGHPLLGERIYGPRGDTTLRSAVDRPMLHAAQLGFAHPSSGRWMQFERPAPVDMLELIAMRELDRG